MERSRGRSITGGDDVPSAIWSGSVGFGLVQVPVRLVTATRSRDVSFNQLEEGSGARIRYKKVSDATGEEVPAERIQKGYEISKGRYVVVEPEELASLAPKASHTIDIEEFVDLSEIDPVYFEQPYYLVPDDKGKKAYRLLVDAMSELNKVAIGRIVIRAKERLVAIRTLDGLLCVETMRYADEVVTREGLAPEDVDVAEREVAMARQLIESLAVDHFEPEKFRDEYREQVLDLVERKAAGEEIVAEPATEAPAKVLDLVAALEASLEKAAGARERHPSTAGLDKASEKDKPTSVKSAKAAKAAKATKTAAKAPAKKAARSKRSA
jgi:DNA end-binding protein Ku